MNRNFEQRFRRRNDTNNYHSNRSNQNNQLNTRYQRNNSNNVGAQQPWRQQRDNRNNNRRQLGNRQRPNRYQSNNNDRRLDNRQNSVEKWFKITVPHASRLESNYIIQQLLQQSIEFVPFNYTTNGNAIEFYVQGDELAHSIKQFSRRLSTPDGQKLLITSERATLPPIDCTNEFIEKLKIVMSSRYESTSKHLNLSKLSFEESFLSLRLFVSLQRINVCKEAVKIIIENIPDLNSLNLSNNKIQNLEPFKPLVAACKNLKKLDLSFNNINNIEHLDNLKGLEIEELNVESNPFKKNIKDKSQDNFVRLMRLRFPKVINLDGISIPPPICFDVEEQTTLPESKGSYIPKNVEDFVNDFVLKYFELFDTTDRQQLLNYYFEQAQFSFSINKDNRTKQKMFDSNLLKDSRNLLIIQDDTVRQKLLKQGRAQVVSTLSSFPKTEHIFNSFKIDIPFIEDNSLLIVINGLYKTKQRPFNIRAFTRNFFIIPINNTFVITNDIFTILNPTVEQINFVKNLFKNENSQEMELMDEFGMFENQINNNLNDNITLNNGIINQINNNNSINSNQQNSLNHLNSTIDEQQIELIKKFSEVTGMNSAFSKQCLEEHNFNPETAFSVFKELNNKNMIPQEAFKH